MKVAILCGGLGTRLSEETAFRPKPMIEIGGKPILWHIMKGYAASGFEEFVLATGYKSQVIKDYFLHYHYHINDVSVRLGNGDVTVHDGGCEDWTVHILDTGLHTMTGGRMRRLARFIGNETFMMTYGDGLTDMDFQKLLRFHRSHKRLVTVSAVHPPTRFGDLTLEDDMVVNFQEKPQIGEGWINAGFFVIEPEAADYVAGDEIIWEREPLQRLAREGQLVAYRHDGFWRCMDTLRDMQVLDNLWESGGASWKQW